MKPTQDVPAVRGKPRGDTRQYLMGGVANLILPGLGFFLVGRPLVGLLWLLLFGYLSLARGQDVVSVGLRFLSLLPMLYFAVQAADPTQDQSGGGRGGKL